MLTIHHAVKLYAPGIGLKEASFQADAGDVVALIGPNGSGKSTLLKIICDVYRPDKGQCLLRGIPTHECKQEIGYLPEIPYLVDALTGHQFLKYIAGMKGISSFDEISQYLALFEAETFAGSKLSFLSQGQRKRIALIAALMGNPYLLILDEPTNGFDTVTLLRIKEVLRKRSEQGKITILSSHVLDFLKNVSSKVVFIREGYTVHEERALHNIEETYIELYIQKS